MTRTLDIVLTFVFISCFGFYTLLGYAFGGLSSENPGLYLLITIAGLVFLSISITKKEKKQFILTRMLGLLLVPSLLYFDIKHSFTKGAFEEIVTSVITYLPVIIFLAFGVVSIIRMINVHRENSG
jgi:hypothetical protein